MRRESRIAPGDWSALSASQAGRSAQASAVTLVSQVVHRVGRPLTAAAVRYIVQMYVYHGGTMDLVVDASAILAVLLCEPQREALIAATGSAALLTPGSTPWEIGNALVAGWRRKRLTPEQMAAAWSSFQAVPLRSVEVDVPRALRLAVEHGLCAYDSYVLEAALVRRAPLLTLDQRLARAAQQAGVAILEVCA